MAAQPTNPKFDPRLASNTEKSPQDQVSGDDLMTGVRKTRCRATI